MTKKKKTLSDSPHESHDTCAWARGNTCKFWGCSHRELYGESETERDYAFFMANSKCDNFKPKKRRDPS